MSLPLALNLLLAASQIWAEPPHVDPGNEFVSGRSMEAIRLYGARGEAVSCWVTVEAGRKPVTGLVPVAEPPGSGLAAPQIWLAEAVQIRGNGGRVQPVNDVLRPAGPLDLERDEIARYWVTYAIPADAPAGVERGELRFDTATRQTFRLPVRIEVFEFSLPPQAAYPILVPLDRARMIAQTGMEDISSAWRGVYDFLGRYRLSPVLWDDAAFFQSREPAALAEHARYALQEAGAAIVDFGGEDTTTRLLQPSRAVLGRADIEGIAFAQRMLGPDGLAVRATVSYRIPEARAAWGEFEALLQGHASLAPDIARMLVGPVAMPLMSNADAWAVLYRHLSPGVRASLAGNRMVPGERFPLHLLQPTPSGRWQGYDTLPSDAFDGHIYSGWVAPGSEGVLDAQFAGPLLVDRIDIIWLEGNIARDIEVLSSRDGLRYARATVDWKTSPARAELGQPAVHRGVFKYPQSILGIKIRFGRPLEEQVIGVAELRVPGHNATIAPAEASASAPEVWAVIEPDQFPAPMPGFHPAAAMLLPWWCAARGAAGARLPGFNRSEALPATGEVVAAAEGARTLVWPVGGVLAPSVRLERIRIGIQSYAYGQIALAAGIPGDWVTDMPEAFNAIALGTVPDAGELDALLENHVAWRVAAGRTLGEFMSADGNGGDAR